VGIGHPLGFGGVLLDPPGFGPPEIFRFDLDGSGRLPPVKEVSARSLR
jgi:hypothetical protein